MRRWWARQQPPVMGNEDRLALFGERASGVMERIAPGYFEADVEAEHLARYSWATELLRPAGFDRLVLDIACGTGYGTPLLEGNGVRAVVGIDRSGPAVTFGSATYGAIGAVGDAASLPVRPRAADAVVSFETIEHLADAQGFLAEMATVLRPGGLLVLSTPNVEHSYGDNPFHLRELSRRELACLLADTGYEVLEWRGQRWELPDGRWRRVRGVRKIASSVEWRALRHLVKPRRRPVPGATPRFLCVVARRLRGPVG